MADESRHSGFPGLRPGFTLLELLVATAIIAVLLVIAAAGLANARGASQKIMCMNQMRDVVFSFGEFADPGAHPYRGDSERYGARMFRLEDFQERLYRVDEFWDAGSSSEASLDGADSRLNCPSAVGPLTRHKGLPCSEYAVTPVENVSLGFNMRLEYLSVTDSGRLRRIRLTSQIRERPWVPLVLDVDGARANRNGVLPYTSAPPAGDNGLYGTGQFWFPGARHAGRCNVGFIGGHVLNAVAPEKAGGWQWSYQPPAN